MPDYIDNHITLFDEVVKIFEEEVKKELRDISEELEEKIEGIFTEYSVAYGLSLEKGINPTKYYYIKTRVKGKKSLKEKFVRKDLGFDILARCGLNEQLEINEKKDSIKNLVRLIDDIIGVRVVSELKHDCENAYQLIKANKESFSEKEIALNEKDLFQQPQKMKNGLYVYKIKGIYKHSYGFELQIKSKIEEAWGDIDHALFYKDYSITPVRNTAQVTMNNVGKLLDCVEEILLGLRSSEADYNRGLEQLKELEILNNELYDLWEKKLGNAFEIGKIGSFLYYLRNIAGITSDSEKISELDCSMLNYVVQKDRCRSYVAIRKDCFELIISEVTYFNWCKISGNFVVTQENYEQELESYLDLLGQHLYSVLDRRDSAKASEFEEQKSLSERITSYSRKIQAKELFLSVEAHLRISEVEAVINDFFAEKESFFIEGYNNNSIKEAFSMLFVAKVLNISSGSALTYLIEIATRDAANLSEQLENIASSFHDYLQVEQADAVRDLKPGDIVKEAVPSSDAALEVLNDIKTAINEQQN